MWLRLQSYMEAVPQDLALGKEIMRISATDIDDGKNSLVHYDIEPKKPEEAKYFHIEKTTGVIILDNVIDVSDTAHTVFISLARLLTVEEIKHVLVLFYVE